MKKPRRSFFSSLFHTFNVFRLIIVNLLFFFLLWFFIAVIAKYSAEKSEKKPTLGTDSVLLIEPNGRLVEKKGSFSWRDYLMDDGDNTIVLSEITDALKHAAHDRRITAVFIDVSGLQGISTAFFGELQQALRAFKESGKKLSVYSTRYSLGSYYIASFADEIYADPLGEVSISGFYSNALFYGGMEKKLGIQWNVIQAGTHKGMAETYSRTGMSDGVKNNYKKVFTDLWQQYVKSVSENRGIQAGAVRHYAVDYADLLAEHAGSSVEAALDSGLITHIGSYRDAGVKAGVFDDNYRRNDENVIDYHDYNKLFKEKAASNKIGVVYLSGVITQRELDDTAAVSSELVGLLHDAADDDEIKAVVLRVNSGGGEVFASESIRRAVELVSKKAKKPVVVSMGSVAASGAYWISSSADYIFAAPYTITGSIGVLGTLPTIQKTLKEYFGIDADGVSVIGRMPYSLFRSLDEKEKQCAQLEIKHTYRVFLDTVAHGRHLPVKTVAELAEGKIYSGQQAKEVHLVDEIGTFSDAADFAAVQAGIKDSYSLKVLEKEPQFKDEVLKSLLSENVRFTNAADMAVLYELMHLTSKKGFYVYTPVRSVWEE